MRQRQRGSKVIYGSTDARVYDSRWSVWVGLDEKKKKSLSVVLVTRPNQFPARAVRLSVEDNTCVCVSVSVCAPVWQQV